MCCEGITMISFKKINIDEMDFSGVYFLRLPSTSKIKIGLSQNIKYRIINHSTTLPDNDLCGYAIKADDYSVFEKIIHLQLNDFRTHGEWFNIDNNSLLNYFYTKLHGEDIFYFEFKGKDHEKESEFKNFKFDLNEELIVLEWLNCWKSIIGFLDKKLSDEIASKDFVNVKCDVKQGLKIFKKWFSKKMPKTNVQPWGFFDLVFNVRKKHLILNCLYEIKKDLIGEKNLKRHIKEIGYESYLQSIRKEWMMPKHLDCKKFNIKRINLD